MKLKSLLVGASLILTPTLANLDLGDLSIVSEDDLLLSEPRSADAEGGQAAAAVAHSVARSDDNKEAKANAAVTVAKAVGSMNSGETGKDVAQAVEKVAGSIVNAKLNAKKAGRKGNKAAKEAAKAASFVANGVKSEATANVVEKLAADVSTKSIPARVAAVESATSAAEAVEAPGAAGKDAGKKIVDAAVAVDGVTAKIREETPITGAATAKLVKDQAAVIENAPNGDAKKEAKAIEVGDAAILKASSTKQLDTVAAVANVELNVAKAEKPRAEAVAVADTLKAVGEAKSAAPEAAAGVVKETKLIAAAETKLGSGAGAAVAQAAADTASADKKAEAATAVGNGNASVGADAADAQAAAAKAVLKADTKDKSLVSKELKEVGAAESEANGNKSKEASTVQAIKAITNEADGGNNSGATNQAAQAASNLNEPALANVARDLNRIQNPAAKEAASAASVEVAKDVKEAGKQGETVANAVTTTASDIKKAGDVGGVVAANVAAAVVEKVAKNDDKAAQDASPQQAAAVAGAESTAASKVATNPKDAKEVAEAEKHAAKSAAAASTPDRVAEVAKATEKVLDAGNNLKSANDQVAVAASVNEAAKVAEKEKPSASVKTAEVATAAVGNIANAENNANVQATATGVKDAAVIIGAAEKTGDAPKIAERTNEVEGALNAAKKVVEAVNTDIKKDGVKPNLQVLETPKDQFIANAPTTSKEVATAVGDAQTGAEAQTANAIKAVANEIKTGNGKEVVAKAKVAKEAAGAIAKSKSKDVQDVAQRVKNVGKELKKKPAKAAKIAKAEDARAEPNASTAANTIALSVGQFMKQHHHVHHVHHHNVVGPAYGGHHATPDFLRYQQHQAQAQTGTLYPAPQQQTLSPAFFNPYGYLPPHQQQGLVGYGAAVHPAFYNPYAFGFPAGY